MVEATCHCGNVSIELSHVPDWVISCNCSICFRIGSLWGYYVPEDVSIRFTKEPTATYSWGDEMILFHHCKNCGCLTHYTTTDKSEHQRTVINFRMVDRKITESIHVRKFDGAGSWTFVDE